MSMQPPPPPPPQQQQQQSSDGDVGVVVAKAKRAAASLWMVIHAQGCRYGGDRCPHRGCSDTKLLLLHVKTCAAGPGFTCPERYHGCEQAKKLLAHYRRCRDIRARHQAAGRRGVRLAQNNQHVCLVCSLMARHARNVLEGNTATTAATSDTGSASNGTGTGNGTAAKASVARIEARRRVVSFEDQEGRHRQPEQRDVTNAHMKGRTACTLGRTAGAGAGAWKKPSAATARSSIVELGIVMPMPPPPAKVVRTPSMQIMPPPPPRPPPQAPQGPQGPSIAFEWATSTRSSTTDPGTKTATSASLLTTPSPSSPPTAPIVRPGYETPPSQSFLMQRGISAVAAVAALPCLVRETTDPSLLGKSFDSSCSTAQCEVGGFSSMAISESSTSSGACIVANPTDATPSEKGASATTTIRPTDTALMQEGPRPPNPRVRQRPRAESYDERSKKTRSSDSITSCLPTCNSFGEFPLPSFREEGIGNEPTFEATLRKGRAGNDIGNHLLPDAPREGSPLMQLQRQQQQQLQVAFGQRRSVSCGTLSDLVRGGCDTIAENSTYHNHHGGTHEHDQEQEQPAAQPRKDEVHHDDGLIFEMNDR